MQIQNFKKITAFIACIYLFMLLFLPFHISKAQTNQAAGTPATTNSATTVSTSGTYNLLAPLPGTSSFNPSGQNALSAYLNIIIRLLIGIAAVLAMVMIVIGGIEYMTSSLVSGKADGKNKISNAIIGLLIALAAYLILFTINPNLLNTVDVSSIQSATITSDPDSLPSDVNNPIPQTAATAAGKCSTMTSGPCAPSNLTAFGANANNASAICDAESGGKATLASGVDKCGSTPFSYGLFQINLIANGQYVTDASGNPCTNLFETTSGTPIVKNHDYIPKGGGAFTCQVIPGQEQRVQQCAAALENPATNIAVAAILYNQNTFDAWASSDDHPGLCPDSVFP